MSKARGLADLGNVYDDGALSNRNLIINGAMQVAQRGTSFSAKNSSHYIVDRFSTTLNSYGIWDTEKSTDAPEGFSSSLKMTCTTADTSPSSTDYCRISYIPEAQDLQQLAFGSSGAKTTTVSFWVKSNVVATYVFWMYQTDSPTTRQINKPFTVDVADTWEYKTITIEGDASGNIANDTGSGMIIGWILSSGTGYTSGTRPSTWADHVAADRWVGLTADVGGAVSNYFQITGVQLEVGDTATPFEHRSYGDELARCQRYFYKFPVAARVGTAQRYGVAGSIVFSGLFPVEMRATPTMASTGVPKAYNAAFSADYDLNNISNSIGTDRANFSCAFGGQSSGHGIGEATVVNLSAATLTADAEL